MAGMEMNAYELANILQEYYDDFDGSFPALEISTVMLRQQADRIAELEKKCKWYDDTYRLPTDQQNAEPVAWMIIDVDNGKSLEFEENKFSEINIPLYTTPQIKELSDEEIEVLKEIIRISDRKHPLWDKAKEFLK
jgi:hypothetical protein